MRRYVPCPQGRHMPHNPRPKSQSKTLATSSRRMRQRSGVGREKDLVFNISASHRNQQQVTSVCWWLRSRGNAEVRGQEGVCPHLPLGLEMETVTLKCRWRPHGYQETNLQTKHEALTNSSNNVLLSCYTWNDSQNDFKMPPSLQQCPLKPHRKNLMKLKNAPSLLRKEMCVRVSCAGEVALRLERWKLPAWVSLLKRCEVELTGLEKKAVNVTCKMKQYTYFLRLRSEV